MYFNCRNNYLSTFPCAKPYTITRIVLPAVCVIGDSVLEAQKWMLAMEGDVLIQPEDLPDFSSAAAVLMACYYVFNIEYQEEAASTLEFIQRLAHHLPLMTCLQGLKKYFTPKMTFLSIDYSCHGDLSPIVFFHFICRILHSLRSVSNLFLLLFLFCFFILGVNYFKCFSTDDPFCRLPKPI